MNIMAWISNAGVDRIQTKSKNLSILVGRIAQIIIICIFCRIILYSNIKNIYFIQIIIISHSNPISNNDIPGTILATSDKYNPKKNLTQIQFSFTTPFFMFWYVMDSEFKDDLSQTD